MNESEVQSFWNTHPCGDARYQAIVIDPVERRGDRLPIAGIFVARQSGWEDVLPHRGMFPRRQALPHQACSRCLTDPLAAQQLLF